MIFPNKETFISTSELIFLVKSVDEGRNHKGRK
jgi:hypothetical protein